MPTKITFPYQLKTTEGAMIPDPVIYLDVFTPLGIRKIGKEKFIVHCYFVKSNTMPLLGRLDIWDKFNWIFDNKKKQVIFERI